MKKYEVQFTDEDRKQHTLVLEFEEKKAESPYFTTLVAHTLRRMGYDVARVDGAKALPS